MNAHPDSEPVFGLPNALYGKYLLPGLDNRFQILARSLLMTESLCRRFETACLAWGNLPPSFPEEGSFFQVPTVLPGADPSARTPSGVLAIAVSAMGADTRTHALPPGFHALFIKEDSFAAFGEQVFGLWNAGVFLKSWGGDPDLPLVEVTLGQTLPPSLPPYDERTRGILARELEHLLLGGDVRYSAYRPEPAMLEHLRVLQLGLPRPLRQQLGFATFCSQRFNPTSFGGRREAFAICGMYGPELFLPGNALLIPPRRPPASSADGIRHYVGQYRDLLAKGDLPGLLLLAASGLPRKGQEPPSSRGWFSWGRLR